MGHNTQIFVKCYELRRTSVRIQFTFILLVLAFSSNAGAYGENQGSDYQGISRGTDHNNVYDGRDKGDNPSPEPTYTQPSCTYQSPCCPKKCSGSLNWAYPSCPTTGC
jgi:hypothetical protein